MKVIDKMISKRGFINFDERTNSIIVRDLESNLELISGVIKSIDTVTPQVMIETKIIETDLGSTENMGIDWTMVASLTGSSAPTVFPFTNQQWFGYGGSTATNPLVPALIPSISNGSASAPAPASTNYTYGTSMLPSFPPS